MTGNQDSSWSYIEPRGIPDQPHRGRSREGEMSCATTLLLALVLIPLVFGGTLFLLNEVGQAYFGTEALDLPREMASAFDRFSVEAAAVTSRLRGGPERPQLGPGESQNKAAQTETASGDSPTSDGEDTGFAGPTPDATVSAVETMGTTATATSSGTGGLTDTGPTTESPTASPTPSGSPTRTPTSTHTSSSTPQPSVTIRPTATPTYTSTSAGPPPSSTPVPATATSGPCTVTQNNGYEGTVLELVNQERVDAGLSPLTSDSRLHSAARGHASDMACNDFFSHTGSDGSNVGDRVSAQGYSWTRVGENIYAGSGSYGSPGAAVQAWMDSPGHRANILNSDFTQIGVGYVYFADSTYRNYYVTVFATPR